VNSKLPFILSNTSFAFSDDEKEESEKEDGIEEAESGDELELKEVLAPQEEIIETARRLKSNSFFFIACPFL
jgi:hypothetical protein